MPLREISTLQLETPTPNPVNPVNDVSKTLFSSPIPHPPSLLFPLPFSLFPPVRPL